MTDPAAVALATVQALQLALQCIYSLALTAWRYPPNCSIVNETFYDFIIVGGGTAGCICANRLSANNSYNVLLVESGGYAPLESELISLFGLLPSSMYEYNMTTVKNNRTSQKLQNQVMELTAGKMLGGTGGLDHVMHFRGSSEDYNNWANMTGDDSWNYTNILEYLKKQENLMDPELLNYNSQLHGTKGPIKISRQKDPANNNILAAAAELGHRVVPDLASDNCTVGITEPLYQIHDNVRQSSAVTYLGEAKSRKNLCVSLYTTAIKILIESGVAVGVRVVDANGNIYDVYAKKEVIISAGALNSPKILMLSGIGPKAHLEQNNIDVVTDLPVGENYQDQPSLALIYSMGNDTSNTTCTNPGQFPLPVTALYGATNSSQNYPDYHAIMFKIPRNSTSLLQICSNVIKHTNYICNTWGTANANRSVLFIMMGLLMPKSRGYIRLASSDYKDNPLVYPEFYTDSENSDLTMISKSIAEVNKLTTTEYFKSVNATLLNPGLCLNATTDDEFWKCYAMEMSIGMWHYVGTCGMGSVLDSNLRVKNVEHLRVIDASAMPTEIRGKPRAAINMIAERGSSLILSDWSINITPEA